MPEAHVNQDGVAVVNGREVQFPISLAGATVTVADDVDGAPMAPNVSDAKAEWELYATSVGVDPEGMTKDELVAACGS